MGNTGSGQRATEGPAKTCYYELLSVERMATQEEIKKAYRRKALELHPDRNYGDVERATKLFAEVQAAYEVLSDPQERTWYDSHREAILGGDDGHGASAEHVSKTTAEDVYSWFSLFPTKSKIDYSDSRDGFYATLRQTFEKLAQEEIEACEEQGIDPPYYPEFGDSRSGYEDYVRQFYSQWIGFRTFKTFAWVDKYKLSDAPERRIRRVMEKENKKLRDEAIREFNDAIRQFVQFARKRDPRYTPLHAGMSEAQRQAAILKASKEQAAKARAKNAATKASNYKVADWMEPVEPSQESQSDEFPEEESEVILHECVACKKTFKTEAQFAVHEKSKKHKRAVYQLKKKMEKEGREMGLDEEEKDLEDIEILEDESAEIQEHEISSEGMDSGEEAVNEKSVESKADGDIRLSPDAETESSGGDLQDGEEDGDSDHVSISEFQSRVLGRAKESDLAQDMAKASLDPSGDELDGSLPSTPSAPKIGKAKLKREKKKAAAKASSSATEHKCVSCHQVFASKGGVFTHLKEFPSHAAPIAQKPAGGSKQKKGKK